MKEKIETLTHYKYNGKTYRYWEDAMKAVMDAHPELLDDDLPDYFDSHVEEIFHWDKNIYSDLYGEP
jgi:hypothetical protein